MYIYIYTYNNNVLYYKYSNTIMKSHLIQNTIEQSFEF